MTTISATTPRPATDRRTTTALTAFLAILRRDLLVTGREFVPFLMQVLLQPLFFLFIFGKVLPSIGAAQASYAGLLLPGIVALTIVTTALQGVTLPLVLDLGFAREIDDRLLAPLPVNLVAIEKLIFAAMRGLIAGTIIFPLAWWILGSSYQVRTDALPQLVGLMILTAIAGACLGLAIGTAIKPEQIGLMFSLIFTPLIFTGCTYYPWSLLNNIKWFQVITLFNPLTYAAEGMRATIAPPLHIVTPTGVVTQPLATLDLHWILLGLTATILIFGYLGLRTFHRRVVN